MKAMLCPNDGTEMHPVRVESHYGQPVILEQCRLCGGIWFDQFELYSVRPGQAQKIELLDSDILACPVCFENSEFVCPCDGFVLLPFSDINFPKEISVARCPECSGFWLNRGEFTRYQELRGIQRQRENMPQEEQKLREEVRALLAEYEAGKSPETLKKLGAFLSREIDPSDPVESLPPEARRTFETVMNALMLLLRVFAFRGMPF